MHLGGCCPQRLAILHSVSHTDGKLKGLGSLEYENDGGPKMKQSDVVSLSHCDSLCSKHSVTELSLVGLSPLVLVSNRVSNQLLQRTITV